MSEHDVILQRIARLEAEFALIDAMLLELLDHLGRRLPDVPLHQRGFGMMDEPPA